MEHYRAYHYKVLLFEQSRAARSSRRRPTCRSALAVVTTHDLPTLRGWWEEHDLHLRDRLDLYPSAEFKTQAHAARASDRRELLLALVAAGPVALAAGAAAAAVFGGAVARGACIPRPVARRTSR